MPSIDCPNCDGTGYTQDASGENVICPMCNGTGALLTEEGATDVPQLRTTGGPHLAENMRVTATLGPVTAETAAAPNNLLPYCQIRLTNNYDPALEENAELCPQ